MENFTLTTTTPPNAKPVIASIADQRLAIDETKNISSLVKATDSDGDTITKYKVKDATGGNSFYVSGSAVVAHPRDYEFNASALSTLSIKGERSGGEQTLQIAAYDGKDWGEWRSFKTDYQWLTCCNDRQSNVEVQYIEEHLEFGECE